MKKLLLSAVFAGIVGAASAQTASTPFKGANVIIIQTPDSAGAALRTLGKILQAQGFVVDRIDYDLGSLVTKPRTIPKGFSPVLTTQAVYNKGSLTLRGAYRIEAATLGQVESVATYSGMEGAANKLTFKELDNAAKAYPGGVISYSKE